MYDEYGAVNTRRHLEDTLNAPEEPVREVSGAFRAFLILIFSAVVWGAILGVGWVLSLMWELYARGVRFQ